MLRRVWGHPVRVQIWDLAVRDWQSILRLIRKGRAMGPEARWASWQRARQAGVLSPNDVRIEEGWKRSSDPTADSIEPPAAGGKPGDASADDPAPPSPPADDGGDKIARLDSTRARHVSYKIRHLIPDGRGRGAERTVRANPAADRRTATTTCPSLGPNGPDVSLPREECF
jgi:hypothetical protein